MLKVSIPNYIDMEVSHLILDYNGTLAIDGTLIEGVAERLNALAKILTIHIVTADTFGSAQKNMAAIDCSVHIVGNENQAESKAMFLKQFGTERTVAIGNGRIDALMLEIATLGIAVIQAEGAAWVTLRAADVVVPSILDALDLLLHPLRLKATLRA